MNTSLIWMWLCLLLESKGAYRRMSWSWGCGWLKCVPLRKARAMDNPREIGKQIDWGTQIHINPPEKIRNSQTGVSRLKEKLGGNHRKRWALCCKGKYSVTTPGNEKKGRKKRRGRRKEERGISVSLSVCWYIIKDTDRLTLSTHTHTHTNWYESALKMVAETTMMKLCSCTSVWVEGKGWFILYLNLI